MIIKNFDELAITDLRKKALAIVDAGLSAINTQSVIEQEIKVQDTKLTISGKEFDLTKYDRVSVIGFGKASCDASIALEKVLGNLIKQGIVIDKRLAGCEIIQGFTGTHPKPTDANVEASQKIVDMTDGLTEKDLVIVVVSGGGSALLCWPYEERVQGQTLYEAFLKAGGTITELNTVRKHISGLKGGGLAKKLYPATVASLIFSDVPGGELSDVASGPTYYDESTVADAEAILKKYNVEHTFALTETPKEKKYFENVNNIALVTSDRAFEAMSRKATELGLKPKVISKKMYDFATPTLEQFEKETAPGEVSFGGGEIRLVVTGDCGSGGRNLYLANTAINRIKENEIFISIASDGFDNCDLAGGIADTETRKHAEEKGLEVGKYLACFDSQRFYEASGDGIMTGQTGANVADIMMYIRE